MSDIYLASCSKCDYKKEIIWPLWACYQWPSGLTIELPQVWAWCNACASIVIAEGSHSSTLLGQLNFTSDVPNEWTAQDIVKSKQYSAYPRYTNLYDTLNDGRSWNKSKIVVFHETMKWHGFWRLTRGASQKCLMCGSTDFIHLEVTDEYIPTDFSHPQCDGTITLTKQQSSRTKRICWTTEGDIIPDEIKKLSVSKTKSSLKKRKITVKWDGALPAFDFKHLDDIEALWEVKLPEDYRSCAMINHGGSPEPYCFPLGKEEGMLQSLMPIFCEPHPWRKVSGDSIVDTYNTYRRQDLLPDNVFPFAHTPGGDLIAFDYRKSKTTPKIIYLEHENLDNNGHFSIIPICNSFTELINSLYPCEDEGH